MRRLLSGNESLRIVRKKLGRLFDIENCVCNCAKRGAAVSCRWSDLGGTFGRDGLEAATKTVCPRRGFVEPRICGAFCAALVHGAIPAWILGSGGRRGRGRWTDVSCCDGRPDWRRFRPRIWTSGSVPRKPPRLCDVVDDRRFEDVDAAAQSAHEFAEPGMARVR